MNMFAKMNELLQYLFEAMGEIFSPREAAVPPIGVQPFDGDSFSQWVDL